MHRQHVLFVAAMILAAGYMWLRGGFVGLVDSFVPPADLPRAAAADVPPELAARLETATLAAGCFWCVEADFDKVHGVVATISGYTGGTVAEPTYAQVSLGTTGHVEAVQVLFDPAVVNYETVLDHFWRNVDPFVAHRQFCDVGSQYRPVIFYHSEAQREAAEGARASMEERFGRPILVEVNEAGAFYRAEAHHQDYYLAHPVQYRYYRWGCGRDARLAEIWHSAES